MSVGVWNVIRKGLATICFWFTVCVGAALATIHVILNGTDHDTIASGIEVYMAALIYVVMTRLGFWRVTYKGQLPRVEDGPFVLAANHQSMIDTVFMALLPFRKTYTYNKKWMWAPVFGWLCWLADFVAIDKSTPASTAMIVPEVVRRVKRGHSVMIYPEGTRNKAEIVTRLMDPVKTGAFRIARDAQVQILPIVFNGTNNACRGAICDSAEITITYGEPFSVANGEVETAIEHFRQVVNAELAK